MTQVARLPDTHVTQVFKHSFQHYDTGGFTTFYQSNNAGGLPVIAVDGVGVARSVDNRQPEFDSSLFDLNGRCFDLHCSINLL